MRPTYEDWKKLGLKVLQEPTDLDFGFTFIVEDPDGHRLRPTEDFPHGPSVTRQGRLSRDRHEMWRLGYALPQSPLLLASAA